MFRSKLSWSGIELIVALMLAGLVVPARSENAAWTGNAMLGPCKNAAERPSKTNATDGLAGICTGAISTLLDLHEFFDGEFSFCPPNNATAEQATRVVVKYLELTPELLDRDLRLLAIVAMRTAWPCKPK